MCMEMAALAVRRDGRTCSDVKGRRARSALSQVQNKGKKGKKWFRWPTPTRAGHLQLSKGTREMRGISSAVPTSWQGDGAVVDLTNHPWPDAVRFIPYWGDLYWEGMDGERVLLLGESHYRKEGLSDSLEVTRPFTQEHFREMASPVRKHEGPFFNALDLVLVGQRDFELQEAADAWKRVAFMNLSQSLAGSQANHRPRNEALREGGDVLVRDILPVLKPTVVLVLGRITWRLLSHGRREPTLRPFVAIDVNRMNGRRRYVEERDVWSLDYKGGSALMTWVYHPSWNVDTWRDRSAALRHLIALSKRD